MTVRRGVEAAASALSRTQVRVEDWAAAVAGFAGVAMMLLETANVVGRYVFSSPLAGTYETTARIFMISMVWLGAAKVQRMGRHIGVDIFVRRLRPQTQARIRLLPLLVIVALWLFVAWGALARGIDRWAAADFNTVIPTTRGMPWLLLGVGSLLLALRISVDAIAGLRGRPVRISTEAP